MKTILNNNKRVLFEELPIPKAVGALVIPAIISQLITTLYNLADSYFVGQLNNPDLIGAVAIVYPTQIILSSFGTLFGAGGSTVSSRFLGSRSYDKVKRASAFAVYGSIALVLVLLLTVSAFLNPFLRLFGTTPGLYEYVCEYLFWVVILGGVPTVFNNVTAFLIRAEGASKEASVGLAGGGLLNMILDPLFIHSYGLGLGLRGAAIATFLSTCATTVYFILHIYLTRNKRVVSFSIKHFSLQRKMAVQVLAAGAPPALHSLLAAISNTVLNRATISFDETAIAAVGICKKVDAVPARILVGITSGVVPLLSYNYGANNRERLQESMRFTMGIVIATSLAFIALLQLAPKQIVELFIKEPKTVEYAANFIRIHCFLVPLNGVIGVLMSYFQARKKNELATILSMLPKGLFDIPLMLVLKQIIPLYGPILAEPIMGFAAMICGLFMYRYVKRQIPAVESYR